MSRLEAIDRLTVPAAYGSLVLDVAAGHGVDRASVLDGLDLPDSVWHAVDGCLSLRQAGTLLYRAVELSESSSIGYEVGLRTNLTSHGFVGYGVLSYATMRQAIEFGSRFLPLRLPNLSMQLIEDGAEAAVDVTETIRLDAAIRQPLFDMFLVSLWRILPQLVPTEDAISKARLLFDYPPPACYPAFRDRLPAMHFEAGANQARFPAEYLDMPLGTADPVTARLVTQQCETELAQRGYESDTMTRVRALLVDEHGRYRGLEKIAASMNMSPRTLKRHLQKCGFSFKALLDEHRRNGSLHLLRHSVLSVEEIAHRAGYTDPANFSRAFRRWTGMSPSEYRRRR